VSIMQRSCDVPELSLIVSDVPVKVPLTPIAPPDVPADRCAAQCGTSMR
jgi:hypothetical protein